MCPLVPHPPTLLHSHLGTWLHVPAPPPAPPSLQDEGQVEDDFLTDPSEHKQSVLGAVQPMVEVVNSEEVTEEVNYEDEEFEVSGVRFSTLSTCVCCVCRVCVCVCVCVRARVCVLVALSFCYRTMTKTLTRKNSQEKGHLKTRVRRTTTK